MANLLVPGKPSIKKPEDRVFLAKLRRKLKEYKTRVTQKEEGWGWTIDAAYKAAILEALLKVSKGGEILQEDLERKTWNDLVCGPMNVVGGTHCEEMFPYAWLTIWRYVHDPEHFPLQSR